MRLHDMSASWPCGRSSITTSDSATPPLLVVPGSEHHPRTDPLRLTADGEPSTVEVDVVR
jgi:hypothetical protein